MVNPNNFATPSAQQQGESLWDGQSEAQKFIDNRNNVNSAVQTSQPTPIPQENGSALNLNGDPDPIKDNKTNFNNKVPDTTFIPKNFNKYRQPPGGGSDVSKFVNKGSYKVGEEIDEDDYSDLGGKLDIHNITPVQTNKGKLFVTGGRKDSNIKFFGKNIPDVQKKSK